MRHKRTCIPHRALTSDCAQVGRWSDAYGRKPFLVICYSFACLPVLILTLHMQYGLSLYFYFPASVRPTSSSLNTSHTYSIVLLS